MHLIPLYEKLVVKIIDNEEINSESGLTYVKNLSISTETTVKAKVIAAGEGRLLQDGTVIPLKVKVGDTVVYSKMYGESFDDGKEKYTLISESNILAIVQEDSNENN